MVAHIKFCGLFLLVASNMHASDALAHLMKQRAEQAMQRNLAEKAERETREREEAAKKRAQELQKQYEEARKILDEQ